MACHEIAALRIALHGLLGDRPEHEKSHEILELGELIQQPGPLAAVSQARDLAGLRRALDASAAELEAKVAGMEPADPASGYHRALVVTVRALVRDLDRLHGQIERLYLDVEDTHDLLHEVFPGSADA